MRALQILISVFIIVIVSAISFYTGREYEAYYYNYDSLYVLNWQLKDSCQKHYEAACLQADFIHYLMDYEEQQPDSFTGFEIKKSYNKYFQNLSKGIYKTEKLTNISQLEEYSWCY